jgi:toxin HigB-1
MAEHVTKLRDILPQLDAAQTVQHMNLPGLRLHPLKGDPRGFILSRFALTGM